MELLHKALDFQVRQVGDPKDRVLEFIGSTADVDRYGDIIEVAGWDLKHYNKNPQFLWAHNYSVPPVGTTRKVTKADGALAFQVYFPTDEEINVAGWPAHVPTPETVYRLYLGGFLRATSVGFQGLEWEPILGEADEQGYRPRVGTRYVKQDLYELSAVPVPANPYALMNAVQKGVVSEEQVKAFDLSEHGGSAKEDKEDHSEKGAIPYKEFPTDAMDSDWSGPKEMGACGDDMKKLKTICTWMTSGKPMEEMKKSDFKLPHHRGEEGHKTVWKGVTTAMAALLGARGGVNIPDADRKGVYNHLAKHYKQFDKTPPEFKALHVSYDETDLRLIELGISPMEQNGEPRGKFDYLRTVKALLSLAESQQARIIELEAQAPPSNSPETKAGAVLSAKNKKALKSAMAMIQQVLDAAEPAEESEDGKEAPPNSKSQSIYHLAFNPGEEPHGERRAGETEDDGKVLEVVKQSLANPAEILR